MGLTKRQINRVVSIRKNWWWICLLCRQRPQLPWPRNLPNLSQSQGGTMPCPAMPCHSRPCQAYDAKHMEGGAGGVGKWQIGPGLRVPGEELTKSLAACRRSLAASPRAKITLRGPPRCRWQEWQKCGTESGKSVEQKYGKVWNTYPLRITAIGYYAPISISCQNRELSKVLHIWDLKAKEEIGEQFLAENYAMHLLHQSFQPTD